MWPFGKPKSYLGVDIGAGGMKIVELRIEKKRPVLFTYGLTSGSQNVHALLDRKDPMKTPNLPAGEKPTEKAPLIEEQQINNYAAVLKTVCEKAKTVSRSAVVSLPVSSVFHAVVTVPKVKREELESIVRAEVKKLLPYPLEDMVLDSQVLPSKEDANMERVLINAVPRPLVVFYTQVFKRAGLTLNSLEPESIALARSLVGHDSSTTMLIDMGAERTNFFIIDNGIPMTHRSTELGGQKVNAIFSRFMGVDEKLVEQSKRDLFARMLEAGGEKYISRDKFLEYFNPIIEPIAKEIEFSFEMYLRQTQNEHRYPEKVIFTGGASIMPYLADFIAQKFKLKCYIGDPWGRVVHQDSLKPLLREIAPRMSVAIGLALRNIS